MKLTDVDVSESAILSRVFHSRMPALSPEIARMLLDLDFDQEDKERMRRLSAKAREGTLSPDEEVRINNYERVGHLLNILRSMARRSLKRPAPRKTRSADQA